MNNLTRGYVGNRDEVRGLVHSLYRKYPIGSLLVWVMKMESATTVKSSLSKEWLPRKSSDL